MTRGTREVRSILAVIIAIKVKIEITLRSNAICRRTRYYPIITEPKALIIFIIKISGFAEERRDFFLVG